MEVNSKVEIATWLRQLKMNGAGLKSSPGISYDPTRIKSENATATLSPTRYCPTTQDVKLATAILLLTLQPYATRLSGPITPNLTLKLFQTLHLLNSPFRSTTPLNYPLNQLPKLSLAHPHPSLRPKVISLKIRILP